MYKIFLSYSSKNKPIAHRLANDLRILGYDIWFDEWKIRVGQCIPTQIERGLEDSDFVVILLSQHSVQSAWVDREWKSAYWDEVNKNAIHILPVRHFADF